MRRLRLVLIGAVVVGLGCDPAVEVPSLDADPGVDGGAEGCTTDLDCDDGAFCNGVEACDPASPDADERGCVSAPEPGCADGLECVERTDTCVWRCPDLDGDGRRDIACGGDDCDDTDPTRAAGLPETCDVLDHDEDCDPTTFGVRDADGDGDPDARCCNEDAASVRACGRDCDDANPFTNSTNPELCDFVDNDCDGAVDEEAVPVPWYRDADSDGFGDADDYVESCMPLPGRVLAFGDCDDLVPRRRPGTTETCDRMDEDCDGSIDEAVRVGIGGACAVPGASGACATGSVACTEAGLTCVPTAAATAEACNGLDDDCDGLFDEAVPGIGIACTVPGAHGVCRGGRTTCTASGVVCVGPAPGPELCSPDNENCDAAESAYDGYACVAGAREACDACSGGFSGERVCDSGCAWSGCAVTSDTRRWNGSDPAMRHEAGHAEGSEWVLTCVDAPTTSSLYYEFDAVVPPGRYQAYHSYLTQWGDDWTYPMAAGVPVLDLDTGVAIPSTSSVHLAFSVGPGCTRLRITVRGGACGGSGSVRIRWAELRRVGS